MAQLKKIWEADPRLYTDEQHRWGTWMPPKFNDLSENDKSTVRDYYKIREINHFRKMRMLAMEASIQLCYQNTMLLVDFFNPPLLDLDYQTPLHISQNVSITTVKGIATARWMLLKITFIIVKVLLSGFSTFSPIIEGEKIKSYHRHKQPAGLPSYAGIVCQTALQIILATGSVFLEWVSNITCNKL